MVKCEMKLTSNGNTIETSDTVLSVPGNKKLYTEYRAAIKQAIQSVNQVNGITDHRHWTAKDVEPDNNLGHVV